MEINVITNFAEMFKGANLWVVNISDKGGRQARGDIMLSVKDEQGQDITILLPSTWLPFDLCQWTAISNFEKSTTLRTYIRKGLLAVIDENTAQRILSIDGSREESLRVQELANQAGGAIGDIAQISMGKTTEKRQLNTNSTASVMTAADDEQSGDAGFAGNTKRVQEMLVTINSTPLTEFEPLKGTLASFLVRSTLDEVKAFASGIDNAAHPCLKFIDVALTELGNGNSLNEDMFKSINTVLDNSNKVVFTTKPA